MEQYISKSALVAELNRRKIPFKRDIEDGYYPTYLCAIMDFEDYLDILEVKEVDLEKETKKWWKEHLHLNPENKLWMDAHQSVELAKHFFELGLKAKNNQDKWNKTNTKPPFTTTMDGNKYSDPMLCYDKFGNYCIAQYVRLHTGHCGWYDGEEEVSITHWKELKAQKGKEV